MMEKAQEGFNKIFTVSWIIPDVVNILIQGRP